LAQAFLGDDNLQQEYRFTNADLGTGAAIRFDGLWTNDRSFLLSATFRYDISGNECPIGSEAGTNGATEAIRDAVLTIPDR
jgi:hypothetical protein